jgi:hypothetical protein
VEQTDRGEDVEMLECVGSLVTNSNECETGVSARVIDGNKCYHALGPLLKTKFEYVTVIKNLSLRPIVNYRTESLTLINKIKKVLMTCDRKILDHHVKMITGQYRWI